MGTSTSLNKVDKHVGGESITANEVVAEIPGLAAKGGMADNIGETDIADKEALVTRAGNREALAVGASQYAIAGENAPKVSQVVKEATSGEGDGLVAKAKS